MCLMVNCIIGEKWHSLASLEIGIVVRHLVSMTRSMARGAVSNNDLVLWWSQWLLQVQFTFIFIKVLEVDIIYFLPKEMEWFPLFNKKSLLDINICCFCNRIIETHKNGIQISFGYIYDVVNKHDIIKITIKCSSTWSTFSKSFFREIVMRQQ